MEQQTLDLIVGLSALAFVAALWFALKYKDRPYKHKRK